MHTCICAHAHARGMSAEYVMSLPELSNTSLTFAWLSSMIQNAHFVCSGEEISLNFIWNRTLTYEVWTVPLIGENTCSFVAELLVLLRLVWFRSS